MGVLDPFRGHRGEGGIAGDGGLRLEDRRLVGMSVVADVARDRLEIHGSGSRGFGETLDLAGDPGGRRPAAGRSRCRVDPDPGRAGDAGSGRETVQPFHGPTSG